MEPGTIVSVAGACLGIIIRTAQDVTILVAKYKRAELTGRLVNARLNTLRATISMLSDWLDRQKAVAPQLVTDLEGAIAACATVVRALHSHVANLLSGCVLGKLKSLWDEAEFLQYQQVLDSQIVALSLFSNVIMLSQTTIQQQQALESPETRRALREAEEKASIYSGKRASIAVSLNSSTTQSESNSSRSNDSSSFAFDDELIGSSAYRAAFRRVMSVKRDDMEKDSSLQNRQKTTSTEALRSPDLTFPKTSLNISSKIDEEGLNHGRPREDDSDDDDVRDSSPLSMETGQPSRRRNWSSVLRGRPRTHSITYELSKAAAEGRNTEVEALCKQGADVNLRGGLSLDPEAYPIHHAARNGHLNPVQILLHHGADPNSRTRKDQTPLHLACQHDRRGVVTSLISAGGYADAVDAAGLRPLHLAAREGHAVTAQILLDSGANVESAAGDLWRPLHFAVSEGHLAVVKVLCAARAQIDASIAQQRRSLHLAAERGHAAVVRYLLEHNADVDVRIEPSGDTPLMLACRSPSVAVNTEVLQVLLDHGAVLERINEAGESSLSAACSRQRGALNVVRLLLDHGAVVQQQDFKTLWRNTRLPNSEKKAVHAALNEKASPELRADEAAWLVRSL